MSELLYTFLGFQEGSKSDFGILVGTNGFRRRHVNLTYQYSSDEVTKVSHFASKHTQ